MCDLRMEIFRHLQKLDVSFFDKNPVGRLMTRVTTDVDALNELFTSGVISVFDDVFTLSRIHHFALCAQLQARARDFAILPFLILVTLMFKIKVRDSYRRVRTAIARINAFLQENITGAAVVQFFGQEREAVPPVHADQQGPPGRQPAVDFLLCNFLSRCWSLSRPWPSR